MKLRFRFCTLRLASVVALVLAAACCSAEDANEDSVGLEAGGTPAVEMDEYLRMLFASPNGFDLVDGVFLRITHCYGDEELNPGGNAPHEFKVVADVWGSAGLIGNGGFEYFLGSDTADFAAVASYLETIGVESAAQAIRDAMALFPDSQPHEYPGDRLKYLSQLGPEAKEELERCSEAFWDSDREMKRKLAAYVRTNAAEFARLKPTQWEDPAELKMQNLEPPPPGASVDQVITWLQSIGATVTTREEALEYEDTHLSLPASGNAIISVTLDSDRSSTDQEIIQLVSYAALSELRELDLDDTYVTQTGLASLRTLTHLENLSLSSTEVRDPWLAELSSLHRLKELQLFRTPVSDEGLAHLAQVPLLASIGLAGTHITDEGIRDLASLRKLRALNLSSTPVTGAGLASLSGSPVEELTLGSIPATEEGLRAVGQFGQLKRLTLSGSAVNDEMMMHLADCRRLEWLDLAVTSLTDTGLEHLRHLSELHSLNLYGVNITDRGLAYLEGLKELRRLSLTETNVSDAGLRHLAGLTNLEELNLGETSVRGTHELRHLRTLTSLEYISLPRAAGRSPHLRDLVEVLPELDVSID